MKVGDLATCVSNGGYFLIVEERQHRHDSNCREFRLRRMSDGYKTRWLSERIWKKVNKTNNTNV